MSKKLGFVRDATGLVRELSFFDSFAVNFVAPSATVGFIITTWTLWLLPGANAPLGIIITGLVGMVTIALIYSLFAASMPRSGGDYVYISRALHPALGFAGNFAQFYMEMLILGGSAIYTQSYLTNAFVSTGLVANNPGLVDIGVSLGSPLNTFIVGTITIVAFALLSIWSTKKLMRIIGVLFVVNLIGILVSIGALAFFDPSKFTGLFNGFMEPYTKNPDSYNTVIKATGDAGFSVPGQWSLMDTVKTIPIHFTWLVYGFWFTYMAGEFKSASSVKRQYLSIGGATLFLTAVTATLVWFVERAAGHEFISSMFYAYTNLPSALPIPAPPYFNLFAGLATGNAMVTAIASIGFIAGALLLTAILYPMLTRVIFAYSFDRLFPSKFADVNQRFGTPHNGIILVTVIGVVTLAIYTLVSPALFAYLTLGNIYSGNTFDFGLVAIAAIAFAFMRKAIYDVSPAKKYHIGGVPLITIGGIITLVVVAWCAYGYATDPAYGIAGIPWLQGYLLSFFIVPLIAFYLIRAYRKRQGLDIDVLFKEIPPE